MDIVLHDTFAYHFIQTRSTRLSLLPLHRNSCQQRYFERGQ